MKMYGFHEPVRMCLACGEDKGKDEFPVRINSLGRPQRLPWCDACGGAGHRHKKPSLEVQQKIEIVRAERRKHLRERRLRNATSRQLYEAYGITIEQYEEMLENQGGVCAICGSPPPNDYHKRLNVDHCHSTGLVRGLLCRGCNQGLGNFRDDIDLMLNGISYLSKTRLLNEEF